MGSIRKKKGSKAGRRIKEIQGKEMNEIKIEWIHLRQVLEEFAEYFIDQARANIAANHSYASGTLADTMDYKVEIGDDHFAVYIELESYWDYLENGRKSGKMPPVYKIYEWINEKGIHPRPVTPSVESLSFAIQKSMKDKKGYAPPREALEKWIRKKGIKPIPQTPSVMSLAWAIATNIGKYGTDPHPFFEKAKKDTIQHFEIPIADAIREDLETYLQKQLDDFAKAFE